MMNGDLFLLSLTLLLLMSGKWSCADWWCDSKIQKVGMLVEVASWGYIFFFTNIHHGGHLSLSLSVAWLSSNMVMHLPSSIHIHFISIVLPRKIVYCKHIITVS
jgi:hypothetical protein